MFKSFLVFSFVLSCCLLSAQQTMNNDSIVKLVKAGFSDDLVVATINASPGQYDTSADGLIAMKKAGVSDKVVAAIVAKSSAGSAGGFPTSATTGQLQQTSTEIPQQFKQSFYDNFENHNFTWGSKEIQLGDPVAVDLSFATTTVHHFCKACPIPENLRYAKWIDDHTYSSSRNDTDPGNRLHTGAQLRVKQIRFLLDGRHRDGAVIIIADTDGWFLNKKSTARVELDFELPVDSLRSGDYQGANQEINPYLVSGGSPTSPTETTVQSGAQSLPLSGEASPLDKQAADLDRQADQAAAKAQELEQKASKSGTTLGGVGGILSTKYSHDAKQWREKEGTYRQQAQQLRAQANRQEIQSGVGKEAGNMPSSESIASVSQASPSSVGVSAPGDPRAQLANEFDLKASDAAVKAGALEAQAKSLGTTGSASITRQRDFAEAHGWREKEKNYRQQAQDLRARMQFQPGPKAADITTVLGCLVTSTTPDVERQKDIPQGRGVLVLDVDWNSWCYKMVIKPGDVITREEWDGVWITSAEQFRDLASKWPPGRSVQLDVLSGEDIQRHSAAGNGIRHVGNAPAMP